MAVSPSKRKANYKWDAENMATLACKVKKIQAEKFKQHCEQQGKKANSVLREFVLSRIGENQEDKKQPESP